MRRLAIVTIIASMLGGCGTTVGDMRTKEPRLVLDSNKDAKQVAICIADTWDRSGKGDYSALMRETSVGYAVSTACDMGYPCSLADVVRTGQNTSQLKVHARGMYSDDFTAVASACVK